MQYFQTHTLNHIVPHGLTFYFPFKYGHARLNFMQTRQLNDFALQTSLLSVKEHQANTYRHGLSNNFKRKFA
jgi:hypothetical protein